MKKQIVIAMLSLLVMTSCANKNLETDFSNQQIEENYPLRINIELRKNSKLKVSIKSPTVEQSTELESLDNLSEYYLQYQSEISKSDYATLYLSTDSPISFVQHSELTYAARKAGFDTFYLREEFGEKRLLGRKLANQKEEQFPPDTKKLRSLILVVDLDKTGKIRLNHEDQGNIDDLSALKARLTQVFNDRSKFPETFREGTNKPETTVYIKIPPETQAFDANVTKLIEALQQAGASPIGIQSGK